MSSTFGSSNGLVVRPVVVVKVVRNEPAEAVAAETHDRINRSGGWIGVLGRDVPDVDTVVSWLASSMKSENGVPRMLSWIWTPSSMKRLSADIAPPMVTALFGPVACAAGERLTAESSVRAVGSVCNNSCSIWSMPVTCS